MVKRKPQAGPFSKILNSLLEERGIGVREAARIAGIGASTVMSWKAGAHPENYIAVKRLAEALGVTLSYVLTGENDATPKNTIPSVTEVFENGDI